MISHTLRAILGLAALLATSVHADELRSPEVYADFEGKALKGYDTVAYHLERKALKGTPQHTAEWKGATWWFTSAANRDRFIAEPERWAPQFGGYCAWAIARDRTAPIDPTIFRVFDDKLYLNLNMKVHKDWLENRQVMIVNANENWPEVLVLAR